MAAGYGPPRIDFGQLGDLGNTFLTAQDAARKRRLEDIKLSALNDLGQSLTSGGTPDYMELARRLAPTGDLSSILTLMKMGQTQATGKEVASSLGDIFSGRGSAAPSVQPRAEAEPKSFDTRSVPSFITATQEKYPDLPAGYLGRTAQLETSGYDPNAVSPTGASGLYQFTGDTARRMGLADRFDPTASTDAAARLGLQNAAILSSRLGRPPEAWELYLAHQQGGPGAAALLSNPNARAGDIVGDRAVAVNGGNPNMTAGQFASLWQRRYGTGPDTAGIPSPATGAGLPTMGSMGGAGAMTPEGFAIPGQMAQGPQLAAAQPTSADMPGGQPAQAFPSGGPAPGFVIPGQPAFSPRPEQPAPPSLGPVPGGATSALPQTPQSTLSANIPRLLALSLKEGLSDAQRSTVTELLKQGLAESGLTDVQKNYIFAKSQGDTRSFPQYQMDLARAGATAVTTNVGGEKAEAAEAGKARGTAIGELEAQGRSAPGNIARLNLLGGLLSRARSGKLGETEATVVGALQSVGIGPDVISSLGLNPNQAFTKEAAEKVINELTVGQIGKGGFPANNFSDADRQFLTKIFPSITNRPEANEIALEVMKRVQQQNEKKSDAWTDYRESALEAGREPSFGRFESQWRRQTRGENIFADLTDKLGKLAPSGQPGLGGAPPPPAAQPPPAAARAIPPMPNVPLAQIIQDSRDALAARPDLRDQIIERLRAWKLAPDLEAR